MSWLIEASERQEGIQWGMDWLNGDALAIMIAASSYQAHLVLLTKHEYSQTVASTLTFLLYHLAREPAYVEKLRAEVDLDRVFVPRELRSLEYLNAVINETLRLYPPVPSSLHRDTPPEGLTIAGRYIPGNTTVITPSYSLARRQLPPSLRPSDRFHRLIR
jgi:hypothetical protein